MNQPERYSRKDVIENGDIPSDGKRPNFDSSSFKYICKVKVVLVGDSGVGKTSLVTRFVEGTFKSERTTSLAVTYLHKEVDLKDHTILFQIWDTAGQERYRSLVPMYLRGAKAALLVYDATNLTAAEFATRNRMLFMETSSKTGVNVDKVFTMLASAIVITEEEDDRNSVLDLTNLPNAKTKRCCSS